MKKEYAKVGEDGVSYAGPQTGVLGETRIAVFGPNASERVHNPQVTKLAGASLVPIDSEQQWGKASDQLVHAIYEDKVVAIIALDRKSSHLAEQIGVKAFVPVLAVSLDKSLTSINIPWIFRMPEGTSLESALQVMKSAVEQAGPDRAKVRERLASGETLANVKFSSTGEPVAEGK
jgi:hypothetical protein